jgi:hypothetical protein
MKKLLLFLMLIATAAQAETYKWTDKEGTLHFSDSLQTVPRSYRKSAVRVGIDASSGMQVDGVSQPDASTTQPAPGSKSRPETAQVEGLKERMMGDQGIMALITAMQGDPEMQAVLNDPAVMSAVQSGDVNSLMHNPTFMKLLNNPRVKQIEKMLEQGGAR